jgi:Transglycosylase SLT domain
MITFTLPIRKICSALPAVALLTGGIILSAPAASTADSLAGLAASDGPVIVVPTIAMTLPGSEAKVAESLVPAPSALAPSALALSPGEPKTYVAEPAVSRVQAPSAGKVPSSSTPVSRNTTGIPVRALESYRLAATLTDSADPGCNIDWALVAAIGQVESNHARFGGNQLDSGAVARPGIIGMALDGSNGTARITDTDGGLLDRDTTYDRAVGPMQFIPGTWRAAGVDADGDGTKNPQDMADAAAATAVYLCSGPGDLNTPGGLRTSILRYNHSDSYVRLVTSIAAEYRQGVNAMPAFELAPAVNPASSSNVGSPASGQVAKRSSNGSSAVALREPSTVVPARTTSPAPKTKAPAPKGKAPAPKAKAPAPKAKAPAPKAKAPAPKTTTKAPAPSTKTKAPAPKTTTKAPAPSTTTKAPAPKPKAPAPKTTTKAPAPTTTTPPSCSNSGHGSCDDDDDHDDDHDDDD